MARVSLKKERLEENFLFFYFFIPGDYYEEKWKSLVKRRNQDNKVFTIIFKYS